MNSLVFASKKKKKINSFLSFSIGLFLLSKLQFCRGRILTFFSLFSQLVYPTTTMVDLRLLGPMKMLKGLTDNGLIMVVTSHLPRI